MKAGPIDPLEQRAMRRVMRRLIPFLVLCYALCWLNRINLSFAALQMNKQLHLSPANFGLAAGLFFISYACLEIPANLLMRRFGARKWLARIMFSTGIIAAATAFVHGAHSFYCMRLLLGAAEAGFYPGILFYLTLWFPFQYRARNYGLFLAAIPLTGIVGGPLSAHLLALNGLCGLKGWQWLFILEGLPSAILAPVAVFYLQDTPASATWLQADEKAWLVNRLTAEQQAIERLHAQTILHALTSPIVWLLAMLYFSNVCLLNSILFFLPQIVKSQGFSATQVGYIAAIPSVFGLIGIIYWGRRSDVKAERAGHAAFANLLAAVALLTAMTLHGPDLRFAAIVLAFASTLCMVAPFWAIPGSFLSGASAAGGIAAISAIGVTGGFVAHFFVGYMKGLTGDYKTGFVVIALFSIAVSIIFYLSGSAWRRPRQKQAARF